MAIDVERTRAETPGCERVLHFNNAGSSLPPTPVLAAVQGHLTREAEIGGYEAEAEAEAKVEHTYDALAGLLGCDRSEIALVENATRAWDMAFYSLKFRPGDRILTGQAEYASNVLAYLQVAARTGAQLEVVPDDEHGQLDVHALRDMLDERVKLVALTHVPTNGGLVNPAAQVGALTRAAGVPFLLDACQSAGQLPLDVAAIGCDMLAATGRKYLRGPRGTGFLYVRRGLIEQLEPPFLDLHAAEWTGPASFEVRPDARRFENWESYVAGRIGLGVAVDYALALGLPEIAARVGRLASQLRAAVSERPGIRVCDKGETRCGIVTFVKQDEGCEALQHRLRSSGINISVSGLTSTRFDMHARGIPQLCRASVHYYNTEQEIARFCAAL